MGGPADPAGNSQDRDAERWLAQLRDGNPDDKAEARWQLASTFERRGMTSEAVELLVANARAGYRSPDLFERLAGLYRVTGDEYLAVSAALEGARLRERAATSAPQPSRAGLGNGALPGSQGSAGYVGQHGPPARTKPRRGSAGPSPPGSRSPGNRWEQPLRAGGWVVFAVTLIAAAAVAGTNPVAAVAYAVAAGALGLLLAGAPGLRQLLRVPSGPLGNGVLMFVALLLFLIGGALLPRSTELPPTTAPPARTPGTLDLGTATPVHGGSPTTPAPAVPPTAPSVASPAAAPQAAPSQASIGPTETAPIARQSVGSPGPAPPLPTVPSTTQTGDLGARVRIANVGAEGVRLRPEPGSPEVLKVLSEGTPLESLGEEQEDGGRQWRRVREPEGLVGWVAADFLAAEPAAPTVVVVAPTATQVIQTAVAPPPPTSPPSTQQPPATATALPRPATAVPPTIQPAAGKPQTAPTTTGPAPAATPRPATPPTAARVAPSGMDCPAGQPVKGNHSSSGEWIYHVPGGQFYRVTRPEDCFATADDARRAGYRPSQR